MNDAFIKIHPISGIIFFAAAIGFTMFFMNPVCIVMSFFCAFFSALIINGKRALGLTVKFLIPMIIIVILINPVFNHRGMTIIDYLPWNNPLTLESIIYGAASAAMFSAVILWFSVFNTVMTSDKIICLFGRIIPALSLVISMTLRFVPRFISQFKQLKASRVNRNKTSIKTLVRELSVMISWALESAVETADSMKSRGYGLKGRTAYNIFKFRKTDGITLIVTLCISTMLIVLIILGSAKYNYFPLFKFDCSTITSILFYILYAGVMLLPMIISGWEGLKWKRLRSAI